MNQLTKFITIFLTASLFCFGCASTKSKKTSLSDFRQEIKKLHTRLKSNSNDAEAWQDLGAICYKSRMIPRAKRFLTKAYKLNNKDPKTLYYVGMVLEYEEKLKLALKTYKKYAQVSDHSPFRPMMEERYKILNRQMQGNEMQSPFQKEQQTALQQGSGNADAVAPRSFDNSEQNYQANDQSFKKNTPPRFRFGIKGGANVDATTDYYPADNLPYSKFDPRITTGYSVGAIFEIRMLGPFYLCAEPLYSQAASTWDVFIYNNLNNLDKVTTKWNFQFIEIPLTLKLRLGSLHFLGGVNYGTILSGNSESFSDNGSSIQSTSSEQIKNNFLAYDAGIGLSINMGKHVSLLLESRFTFTQDNIVKNPGSFFKGLNPGGPRVLTGLVFSL